MTLQERLAQELKSAMLSKDAERLSTLRLLKSAVGYAQIERKTDNLVDYTQYSIAYDALAISNNAYAYTRFADANGNLIDPSQYTSNKDKYTKMTHELRLSSPAMRAAFSAAIEPVTPSRMRFPASECDN